MVGIIIIATIIGLAVGFFVPYSISTTFTPFVAMGLLAAMDTIFGGASAEISGKFNTKIFISGFFSNTVLAVALSLFGKKLGIDISLAVIVVFGTRLSNNFSFIRQQMLQNKQKRVRIKNVGVVSNEIHKEDKPLYENQSCDQNDVN